MRREIQIGLDKATARDAQSDEEERENIAAAAQTDSTTRCVQPDCCYLSSEVDF